MTYNVFGGTFNLTWLNLCEQTHGLTDNVVNYSCFAQHVWLPGSNNSTGSDYNGENNYMNETFYRVLRYSPDEY